jgi:hypothetical protein
VIVYLALTRELNAGRLRAVISGGPAALVTVSVPRSTSVG